MTKKKKQVNPDLPAFHWATPFPENEELMEFLLDTGFDNTNEVSIDDLNISEEY